MPQISRYLLFVILGITGLPIQCSALGSQARGFCGTGPPEEPLRAEHERLNTLESQGDLAVNYASREVVRPIEIATWFHILLSSEDDAEMVSDEMIVTQVCLSPTQRFGAVIDHM